MKVIHQDIIGVVVCGGESMRMGKDKSMLVYHNKPQRYYVYDLLKKYCMDVFLSVNHSQVQGIDSNYEYITDDASIAGHGPISGLLSCFASTRSAAILFVGCDYPFLEPSVIEKLIVNRSEGERAIYYGEKDGRHAEPLIAIYEHSSEILLIKQFQKANYSLRSFLRNHGKMLPMPTDPKLLQSIDTFSDYLHVKSTVKIPSAIRLSSER